MIVQTKFFGNVEFDEKAFIFFNQGLLGFPEERKFVIFDLPRQPKIKCLQSTAEKEVAFLVINPWDFFPDYDIEIEDRDVEELDVKEPSEAVVYNILTVGSEGKTVSANLLGPIVINSRTRTGKQIVLQNSPYTTKHYLNAKVKGEE